MLRESLSVDLSFYNFNSPEGIVDARFMGNASRFINHGNEGEDNLRSVDMLSGGRYRVAFFANRVILEG
jgi:SET domain-containing protein